MFTTAVLFIIFVITSFMVPLMWIAVFSLLADRADVDWFKVVIVSAIWFASGSYLFG